MVKTVLFKHPMNHECVLFTEIKTAIFETQHWGKWLQKTTRCSLESDEKLQTEQQVYSYLNVQPIYYLSFCILIMVWEAQTGCYDDNHTLGTGYPWQVNLSRYQLERLAL